MAAVERFDIEIVTQKFQDSLIDKDDILTDKYLDAYDEINKFFSLMGSVFGFVSSDICSKMETLRTFRSQSVHEKPPSSQSLHDKFFTINTMLTYEKESDLFKDKSYVSGSRTLLRLHRGLEFVYEFLLRLADLSENEKTNGCCKSAYNDTLAKHHSFLIRKGAVVAMYALPTQGELLKRVCVNVPRALEFLPEMLKITKMVYDRTHQLYTLHDLHTLP